MGGKFLNEKNSVSSIRALTTKEKSSESEGSKVGETKTTDNQEAIFFI